MSSPDATAKVHGTAHGAVYLALQSIIAATGAGLPAYRERATKYKQINI